MREFIDKITTHYKNIKKQFKLFDIWDLFWSVNKLFFVESVSFLTISDLVPLTPYHKAICSYFVLSEYFIERMFFVWIYYHF